MSVKFSGKYPIVLNPIVFNCMHLGQCYLNNYFKECTDFLILQKLRRLNFKAFTNIPSHTFPELRHH